MRRACTSTPCPEPGEATNRPSTRMQAPVVTGLSVSSAISARSTTTWILPTHEPSFKAMNATFLLPRLVRTQPFTTMSVSTTPDFRISAILCVFMTMMLCLFPNSQR